MFEQAKALCDSFLELGIPGFDLAVYQDGACILRYMRGYSDRERRIPMNGRERYYIYSCSKPITCAAAMQLWEKGLFSLEDELGKYMPEFAEMTVQTENGVRKAEKPIRIKHLFEMTAGFSYDVNSPQLNALRVDTKGRCPTRAAMAYLAKEPLLFEPGERWNYSLCHDVLAALVEVLSGQRFEDYVLEHIFRPLGMADSTFLLREEEKDTLAVQYCYEEETGQIVDCGKGNMYLLGSEYASGGAGCVSTVDDYIKFLEALRVGDRILKKETIALMATDRLSAQQKQTYTRAATNGYGLGLRTPKAGGQYQDFGWGGAAGAHLAVDVPNGLTVYYSQHVLASPVQALRPKIYEMVLADLRGEVAAVQPETTEPYAYTY